MSDSTDKYVDPENGKEMKREDMLERIRTTNSINIPPEVFEQMFLAPNTKVKGELRQTFGNPTGIAIGGFLLCTTPLSMILLGWRGAGGLGAAINGAYFYLGGLFLTLGGVGEWILGNTFPAIVFTTFGGFWFTFGATLVPFYNAYGAYATDPENLATGQNATFFASFAYFLVAMDMLVTVYAIAAIRTNICFLIIFVSLIPTFGCLAAAFFELANGNMAGATTYQHVGAGLLMELTFVGWYIFLALVLSAVDFPIAIPLGDLSTKIPGLTDRQKKKNM